MSVRLELSFTRRFEAEHSLAGIGATERHVHAYEIECGYAALIDPQVGYAKPLDRVVAEIDAVITPLRGTYLNDVLQTPPTAEMLACWVLARLTADWEWVEVRAYEGYRCRVRRRDLDAATRP